MSSSSQQRGFRPFGVVPVSHEDVEAKNEKAYPKEKLEKYQRIKDKVIGAEKWDLHRDVSSIVGPDYRSEDEILQDLEEKKKMLVR
jgi:hypothetical protein